jgi:hypothetical protein
MKKIVLIIFLIVVIFFVYVNLNLYIKNQDWKYSSGSHIGDFVIFDKSHYDIKGRKIYKEGKIIGKVFVCLWQVLIIKDTESSNFGYYSKK